MYANRPPAAVPLLWGHSECHGYVSQLCQEDLPGFPGELQGYWVNFKGFGGHFEDQNAYGFSSFGPSIRMLSSSIIISLFVGGRLGLQFLKDPADEVTSSPSKTCSGRTLVAECPTAASAVLKWQTYLWVSKYPRCLAVSNPVCAGGSFFNPCWGFGGWKPDGFIVFNHYSPKSSLGCQIFFSR